MGSLLDAGNLTVAAAMNHADVTVWARPKVAIIATGDELVSVGTAPEPGPDRRLQCSWRGASRP